MRSSDRRSCDVRAVSTKPLFIPTLNPKSVRVQGLGFRVYPGQTILRPTPGTCRLTGTEGRTLRVGRVDAENPGGGV